MSLVINRRNANAAAAAEVKRKREEAAGKVEATIIPTVHVGLNRGSSVDQQVTVAAVGAGPVGAAKRALETGEGSVVEPDPKGKKKKIAEFADVVDIDDDGVIPSTGVETEVQPGSSTPHVVPQQPRSSALPIYFDGQFMKSPPNSSWARTVTGALTDVSPLPNFANTAWPHAAKLAIGEGLARRVAAATPVATDVPAEACMEIALAEIGMASHAVSNCVISAIEGLRRADLKRAEEQRVAGEAHARAVAEKQTEMEQVTAELQAKLDEAKKIAEAADLKSKTLENHLAKALNDLKAEKATRKKAEAALDISGKMRQAAEKRAEEAEASVPAKIETAIKDFQKSEAFWDLLMASYDSGLYHMARCLWRDAQQGKAPTLQDFTAYAQENGTSDELVSYHSVIPFSESEMKEINGERVKNGLPVLEFPAVVIPNMRVFQEELEKKVKAELAAAQAEEAAQQSKGQQSEEVANTDAANT